MTVRFFPDETAFLRKCSTIFLALCWCSGLYFSWILYDGMGGVPHGLLQSAVGMHLHMEDLLISGMLPFIVSWLAVYGGFSWLMFGIVFIKALLHGYYSLSVMAQFGSAGWLLRCLLLFSDSVFCVLLILFWISYFRGEGKLCPGRCFCYFSAVCLVCSLDVSFVAPILGQLSIL